MAHNKHYVIKNEVILAHNWYKWVLAWFYLVPDLKLAVQTCSPVSVNPYVLAIRSEWMWLSTLAKNIGIKKEECVLRFSLLWISLKVLAWRRSIHPVCIFTFKCQAPVNHDDSFFSCSLFAVMNGICFYKLVSFCTRQR